MGFDVYEEPASSGDILMTTQPIATSTYRRLLLLVLSGLLALMPLWGSAATAQDQEEPDLGGIGQPKDREDAGGRDPNSELEAKLLALTPLSGIAETMSPHPTFWAHVPANQYWVMLRVEDVASGAQVAPIVAFPVGDGPGLMRFQWPESMPALEIDRIYQWTLVYCCSKETVRSQLIVTGQVVRRTDVGLNSEGIGQDPVAWSMEHGFWLEAVAIVANRRWDAPERVEEQWRAVLSHPEMALEEVLNAPVSLCCSVDGQ